MKFYNSGCVAILKTTMRRIWGYAHLLRELCNGNVRVFPDRAPNPTRMVPEANNRFIVFLVAGRNEVNGGWMSIFSIMKETKKLFVLHGSEVIICTALGEASLKRYTKFDNEETLIPFNKFLKEVPQELEVLLHVPECFLEKFIVRHRETLRSANVRWHFNILLQNIEMIPNKKTISKVKELGPVTATVAHAAYANEETASRLGCQVQLLSTWVCPEAFQRTGFSEKENLIVISPDKHALKSRLIRQVRRKFSNYEIIEIRNMTYYRYKKTVQRAKFTFSFGEGLDGYFIETIFSGGIGMTFFNDRFFTVDYKGLDGIFNENDSDLNHVLDYMKTAESPDIYNRITHNQFRFLEKKYVYEEYLENLRLFYRNNFPAPLVVGTKAETIC